MKQTLILQGSITYITGELIIHNNNITGVVDDSLCTIRTNAAPPGELYWFEADCAIPASGGLPEIECSCCTDCYE